jgi:hypothetical protein
MKSYTQGNFASNNVSLIQQTFVGRSILFMRKHIYNPLMRRIGSKRYTGTGHEIEGYYRVIGAMLKSSWTNKNMGYITNRSNEEKIAVNALLKDVVATTIIGVVLYYIEKAFKEGEGDDEEDWLAWYSLLIFRKVVSEVSFLNPIENLPGNGIGHFLGAMRIDAFRPAQDFIDNIDNWIDAFKSAEKIDEKQPVIIPGEPEFILEKERKINGIPLNEKVIDDLKALATKYNLAF